MKVMDGKPQGISQAEKLRQFLKKMGDTGARPAATAPLAPPPRLPVPPMDVDGAGALAWICSELRHAFGTDGGPRMVKKIDELVATRSEGNPGAYVRFLSAQSFDDRAWRDLVETALINETYFLRDYGQLELARKIAMTEIIRKRATDTVPSLRLWSAACSTGEEAYSLVFLALDALSELGEVNVQADGAFAFSRPWRLEVLGTDLSSHALAVARSGIYQRMGIGSLRSVPHRYWRYFDHGDGKDAPWSVHENIKKIVTFDNYNLISGNSPPGTFDLVFCRNVLIYFDKPMKRRVIELVHRSLAPGGYAVFGPGDIPDAPTLFSPQWADMAVIYKKVGE